MIRSWRFTEFSPNRVAVGGATRCSRCMTDAAVVDRVMSMRATVIPLWVVLATLLRSFGSLFWIIALVAFSMLRNCQGEG